MDNRNLSDKVVINNISQARELVNKFLNEVESKFTQLDSKNVEKNQKINGALATFDHEEMDKKIDLLSVQQKIKVTSSINTLKANWKKKRNTDTLTPVNPNGFHQSSVNVFVNGQAINKNLNKNKQDLLLNAYRNQQWKDPIFTDPLFLETALALFASDKISSPEFETLLLISYAATPLIPTNSRKKHSVNFYSILDENNRFTSAAINKLLRNLSGYMRQEFNSIQINNLRLLLQAFFEKFPSENIFFTVVSNEYYYDGFGPQLTEPRLAATLYDGAMPVKGSTPTPVEKLFLACLVENALQLACFPLPDIVPVRSMAGILRVADIEKALNIKIELRPGEVSFPGVPGNREIHGMKNVSPIGKMDHDRYHAHNHTRQGKIVRSALSRIKDLSKTEMLSHCRQLQGKSIEELTSAITWELTDAEFSYYNSKKFIIFPEAEVVENFCKALNENSKTKKINILLKLKEGKLSSEPSDLGILTFVDMVKYPDRWKEFNFNPADLIGDYKKNYLIALELMPHFTDSAKHNIILFRAYLVFGKENFGAFLKLSADQFKKWEDSLEFKRNNLIKFLGLIDPQVPSSIPSDAAFMFSVLKMLPMDFKTDNLNLMHEDNFKNNIELFRTTFLIYLHLNHFPFIKKSVLTPLYALLLNLIENNVSPSAAELKSAAENLNKFLTHHILIMLSRDNGGAPEKKIPPVVLAVLEEANNKLASQAQEYGCTPEFLNKKN